MAHQGQLGIGFESPGRAEIHRRSQGSTHFGSNRVCARAGQGDRESQTDSFVHSSASRQEEGGAEETWPLAFPPLVEQSERSELPLGKMTPEF